MGWVPTDGELFINWSRGPMAARSQLHRTWLLAADRERHIVQLASPGLPPFDVDLWRALSEGA